jgi:AcrR family transcriptional regulator
MTKGEKTRERILEAALTRFSQQGFAETTMRQIAQDAECSLGLAYRYFESKDAMVLALYERLVAEFEEEVDSLPPGPLAARWAQAERADLARLTPYRGALVGLTSAGLLPGSKTQVLGEAAAPLRRRMLTIFETIVTGASDAPKAATHGPLTTLFYATHLLIILFWLQDPTPEQKTTWKLLDFGEEILGKLKLVLRLPWTGALLTRAGELFGPLFTGTDE